MSRYDPAIHSVHVPEEPAYPEGHLVIKPLEHPYPEGQDAWIPFEQAETPVQAVLALLEHKYPFEHLEENAQTSVL